MIRFLFTVLITLIFLIVLPLPAAIGEEKPHSPLWQAADTDLNAVQEYIDQLDAEIKKTLPNFDFKEFIKKISLGEVSTKPTDIFLNIFRQLFKEVVANLDLLGRLLVLAVICTVLHNVVSSFTGGTAAQTAHAVAVLVLTTIAIGSFQLAVGTGKEVVDRMVSFMQALMPLLLTLLVAVGGVTSAALFSPTLLITISVFGTLIKNVILPLLFLTAVLALLGGLSDRFKVSAFADLLKTAALGILGLFSTIFLGLLAVQGVAGAVGDSIAFKTAKFGVDAFVPVVGGVLADALEAVIGSSLLIKNAVGIAGMAVIATAMLVPLLKIVTMAFIYKLAGALIQPVGDGQIVGCLNGLYASLLHIFAAVATAGLLFFFTIVIVIGVGNAAVMLR